jgi:undecaprenyl-diphosphatase
LGLFQAILLGLLQGATEFLPISSSGHLVLAERFLNVGTKDIVFNVFVHFGTFVAVVVYFRGEVRDMIIGVWSWLRGKENPNREGALLAEYIAIGTIPAVILGVAFKGYIEAAFQSPVFASAMLVCTGFILLSTRFAMSKERRVRAKSSLIIGCAQAIAMLPGISRSGTTISAGLFLGISKEKAATFSFLLALPAIFGATLLELKEALDTGMGAFMLFEYSLGTIAAALFGYLCIALLLGIIRKGKFDYFGYYCLAVGLFGLVYFHV